MNCLAIRKFIRNVLIENYNNQIFNPHKYNSFSELTKQDLYDIAKWGLMNDFQSNGAWDCADDNEENIEKAINCVIEGFQNLLNDGWPDGFKNVPEIITIYRMVVLNKPEDLNRNNLGLSWFSNPNRIKSQDFKQQMWHLKTNDLYLITTKVPLNKVDIPRSLFQRDMVWLENEIVLKDDANINIASLDKLNH